MSQITPTSPAIDLRQLSIRESEQIEWKENVADVNDVVATLSAFANDLANLGGGYVICGAREEKDEHGFPQLMKTGLIANRLKEIEGRTLSLCRDRVSPSITPRVEKLQATTKIDVSLFSFNLQRGKLTPFDVRIMVRGILCG